MLHFSLSRRQTNSTTRRRQERRRKPLVEDLEGRQLLSTFKVTSTSDSGAGSLRQAIMSSNSTTGSSTNTIDFSIGTGGTETITLLSALPAVTHPVLIDGTTQGGTGSAPRIVLNGSKAGSSAIGLELEASGSTVKGLAIVDFASSGVLINSASNDVITDDYIGLTATGTPDGNGADGVTIEGSSSGNTIGGTAAGAANVISGNDANGVQILGPATGNMVEGNLIGTNTAGSGALPNAQDGVRITGGSSHNTIGGTASSATNVISGNSNDGISIDCGSPDNLIQGNLIGTQKDGEYVLPDMLDGVLISGGSASNTVGGTAKGAGNVIAGNARNGVQIDDANSNFVQQNLIGNNKIGTVTYKLPNTGDGVLIDVGSSGNLVEGNRIGTNMAGTSAVANSANGVEVDSAPGNTIGGTTAGTGNTISGNTQNGVYLTGSMTKDNLVEGNVIGGSAALKNGGNGVLFDTGADDNTIGGTTTSAANTISYNGGNGVYFNEGGAGGAGNLVQYDVFNDNQQNGVCIDDSNDTLVIDCTIEYNTGYGIKEVGSKGYSSAGTVPAHNVAGQEDID